MIMKFKKVLALLTVVALSVTLCGCKKNPQGSSSQSVITEEKGETKDYITLLYSMADTFDPYTAKTDINRQLCCLLYEPLIKLDNEFNTVYSVAKSAELSGKECIVKIKDLKFSDGSTVTADDVVYSCKSAMASATVYATKLYEVSSISAQDSKTVVFKLNKQDPYFINLLDFPIIKAGSEKISDSDSVLQPPIGCGRYKVSKDRQSLEMNDFYSGKKGSVRFVKLINSPDSESVAHYVEIGASDIYYSDVQDGKILRMSGQKADINLNNLVYIGINQNYGQLSRNELRQALSSGINRKKICQNAFYNNALPATGFFNPVWEPVKAVQNIQIEGKSQITVENLEQIGYNNLDSKGNRINSSGNSLSLTLLVNSENRIRVAAAQLIASQLAEYGIRITVIEKSYDAYKQCLETGDFQLFLGEVKFTDNMDISCMVLNGGNMTFGMPKVKTSGEETADEQTEEPTTEETTSVAVNQSEMVVNGFYEGKNSITDIATVLQTEMPFIPICYRTGVLFYNDHIENFINSSASDIYFSIESYTIRK